jgi:methionine-rich copper-binding protein CopC
MAESNAGSAGAAGPGTADALWSLPCRFVSVAERCRLAVAVAVAGLVTVGGAGPSAAHADLVAAMPEPCEVVAEVTTVDVRFDEPLVATSSEVTLADAQGVVVATGGSVTDTLFQGTMSVVLDEPLSPGDYQVTWSNTSARDGDTDQGRYGFTVGSAGAVSAPDCSLVTGELAQVELTSESGGGGLPLAVILAGAAVVVAAVGAFVVLRRQGAPGRS